MWEDTFADFLQTVKVFSTNFISPTYFECQYIHKKLSYIMMSYKTDQVFLHYGKVQ